MDVIKLMHLMKMNDEFGSESKVYSPFFIVFLLDQYVQPNSHWFDD